ncbi:hypothetical protein [Streptomyces parvus]|uniref:Secreted protein n=1 Tax=Streptomyces parvus TaxID=66428 RepID=A0A5D4HMJ0_9ACTN|nr:hypothetical protein [Streptomyces parvus]TYR40915.1 hypothetical protein FY004_38425 [Streptomyces parvus]
MSMMKQTSRWAAGLLTVGGVAAALLAGPVAGAQADGSAARCAGGCPQVASSGYQVSSAAPECSGGCPQAVASGYQVSSGAGDLTTDSNWDPL